MLRVSSGLVALMVCLGTGIPAVQAAEAVAARQFGAGVHDYYQGRYFEAVRHFDQSIGYDARDPRPYFFRGLAKQRLGWTGDARGDFLVGSQLEVALKRRDVGMALQRIQGGDRLLLERYRREARLLPEAMVQNVVPPAPTAIVQPRERRSPSGATRASYQLSDLPSDATDPFDTQAPGMLGRGELQPVEEPAADAVAGPEGANDGGADDGGADDFGGESPFGSGVVAEAESDDQSQDPFALGDEGAGDAGGPAAGGAGRGPVGAAIRAFSRSVAPAATITEQGGKLLKGIRGDAPADDPFAEPADQPPAAADDIDDPFAAGDDPFADPADATDPPAQPPAQPPAGDADDPFADDDPFDF